MAAGSKWYLGEWWDKEYSTAECDVYLSGDGKKRLYVYWDGTKEVKPAEPRKRHAPPPEISRFNTQYSINQLQEMARSAGVSPTGPKQDLIQRLLDKGVLS